MVTRPSGGAVPQRDNDSAPVDSNAIVDYLAGGLNTITASINTPRGDSPYMRNVLIDNRGNVTTRNGCRYQLKWPNPVPPGGTLIVPFTAKNGLSFTLQKVNNAAYLFENQVTNATVYTDDELTFLTELRLTFTGCFANSTARITPDYVVINEEDIRILMTFGIAAPVQFRLLEYQNVKTEAANYTTTTFTGENLEFATTGTVLLYVNGARLNVTNVSWSAGVLTVTHPTVAAGTYTHDLMFMTWQWICEGVLLRGSDLYDNMVRPLSNESDLVKAIPINLLKGIEQLTNDRSRWPILLYHNETRTPTSYMTNVADRRPTGVNTFTFSSGGPYRPSLSDPAPVPGFTHYTEGGTSTGGPFVMGFARALKLEFDGDNPQGYLVASRAPYVYMDGTRVNLYNTPTSTDPVGLAAYLRIMTSPVSPDFWSDASLATGTYYKFISFDAAPSIGLDFGCAIEIIYPFLSNAAFIGTQATQGFDPKPRLGWGFPIFGMQEHANYRTGSFPRTCHLYQGRLVFGGFPADPNKVVLSEVAGTAISGGKYANVGIKYSDNLDTDPLAVRITSSEDGARVTALSSAVGSLIIFTLGNTYRLVGANNGPITPFNAVISGIAAVGCCNPRSLVQVANSVTFLTLSGVYRLSPALQIGDFDVTLTSVKVNNLLQQRNNVDVAWMFYDDIENRIFLGFTDSPSSRVANRMLVYFVQWEAWSEYTMYTGLWTCSGAASIRLNKSYQVFHMNFFPETSSNQKIFLVSLGADNQLNDWYFDSSIWPAVVAAEFNRLPFVRDTVTRTSTSRILRLSNFRMLPFQEVRDVAVLVNGVATDNWRKLATDQIELGDPVVPGDVILAVPRNDLTQFSSMLMFVDNVLVPTTVSLVSNELVISPVTDPGVGPISRFGTSIPFAYTTSVFNRNTLVSDKLNIDFYILCNNAPFYQQFQENEVNTAVSQPFSQLAGRFKFPVRFGLGRNIEVNYYDLGLPQAENLENVQKFDLAAVNEDGNTRQLQRYARVGSAVKGSHDVVQCFVYNNDYGVFSISAYQFVATVIGSSKR